MKAKVKLSADGRFRPLLTYGEGPRRYGPVVSFSVAVTRARKAEQEFRNRALMLKGILAEHKERMEEMKRRRPMGVYYAV
ncbi:hypothetical protein AEAC466_04495 [Asticcacaulis sp. AC466]|uniref:hypothetical protein n=1 Tax=Asticcacaulis sp. AC466 TaxID=1282362 RepID=UPI0003C40B54|nr:hypothetical protein [Asticcacaulis sp. AC466]ESQ85428.1 hypothetical protein AEAC466_04495 [Asticcacaulis sp. AC466]